jgi:hypothetical protein
LIFCSLQPFEAGAELVHAGALCLGERVNLCRVENVYAPDRDDPRAWVTLFAAGVPERDLLGVFRDDAPAPDLAFAEVERRGVAGLEVAGLIDLALVAGDESEYLQAVVFDGEVVEVSRPLLRRGLLPPRRAIPRRERRLRRLAVGAVSYDAYLLARPMHAFNRPVLLCAGQRLLGPLELLRV